MTGVVIALLLIAGILIVFLIVVDDRLVRIINELRKMVER